MSRAFLDEVDDIQLVYATIDDLKLNPHTDEDDSSFADHCIVERIMKDGQHLIYDTSSGFVYDKKLMEYPKIRKINKKSSIIEFVKFDKYYYHKDIERDKYVSSSILQMIEMTYGRPTEMYSNLGIELLQREIEYFKKVINYDDVCKEIDNDMKRLGLRR